MSIFTQMVYVIGRLAPDHVQMLGTGFLVRGDGHIATTYHIVGPDPSNLVVLAPHTHNINEYQDISDTACQTIPATVEEIDPIRDLAVLKTDITLSSAIPKLGSFDDSNVGDEVGIFGFPHCPEGRRALTFQKTEIRPPVPVLNN